MTETETLKEKKQIMTTIYSQQKRDTEKNYAKLSRGTHTNMLTKQNREEVTDRWTFVHILFAHL